jgi:hypothetical protein
MSIIKASSRNGVLALNIVLVSILCIVVLVPQSEAQLSGESTYIAIPSEANGLTTGAVYILNTSRQELVAVAWNRNKNKIMPLGYRNISIDANSVEN